jgi:TetR/AcrR family transcriptional repressor of nem operon
MPTRAKSEVVPSETKRSLLDSAVKIMRANGYNATSVDDICKEAGVTKGSFFHYFKSKEDLTKAAIARFAEDIVFRFENAPFRKILDPLERLHARLEFAKESLGGTRRLTRGCLVGMIAQETSLSHTELRSAAQTAFESMADEFRSDVEAVRAAQRPAVDFDPSSITDLYFALIQGSMLMAKASDDNAVLMANIEHFRAYLDFLVGAQPKRQIR